jgi:hypothetical protein
VAANSRRRHHRGEAVEQLERGHALRAAAAGARFRGLVDEVLAVELAQPVQGERWPGAIAQQALAMPFYHPVIEEGLRTAPPRRAGQARERARGAHAAIEY